MGRKKRTEVACANLANLGFWGNKAVEKEKGLRFERGAQPPVPVPTPTPTEAAPNYGLRLWDPTMLCLPLNNPFEAKGFR
ncbi:hypothetical protein VNO78_23231 [Psophocarpus tetragonolobus]|uniref:Uncharacterized protein n=1 Tax=Psophocarpus tetragonolobus TaxID=3891 RepID=A0AAN9S448_PSOTE